MRNRITLLIVPALSLVVATAALAVHAAPPDRMVRIGMITYGSAEGNSTMDEAVRAGLREHGYIEGKNVSFVKRFALRLTEPMDAYVKDLIAEKVDVIVTGCGWSTRVAIRTTKTMPIVMVSITNPVEHGYMKSLARPGANATGVSGMVDELGPKMLDHLKFARPDAKVVGVLRNERSAEHQAIYTEVEAIARTLNLSVVPIEVRGLKSEQSAVDGFKKSGAQALLLLPDDGAFWPLLGHILSASDTLRLPLFSFRRDIVDMGGFLSYGADMYDQFRKTGAFIDKILNGASPGDIPVELPTQLEFAVNLKKAAAWGIPMPRSVLMRANTIVK